MVKYCYWMGHIFIHSYFYKRGRLCHIKFNFTLILIPRHITYDTIKTHLHSKFSRHHTSAANLSNVG